jgi:hypothetical protein
MVTSASTYQGRSLQRAFMPTLLFSSASPVVYFVLENNEALPDKPIQRPPKYARLDAEVARLQNWYAAYASQLVDHPGIVILRNRYKFQGMMADYHVVDEFYVSTTGRIFVHFQDFQGHGCVPPPELIVNSEGWFVTDGDFRAYENTLTQEEGYLEYKNRKEFFLKY